MKSSRRVNTAATLQAVYLVWLFLRITTMCNLSVFGLVRRKFPKSFAHVQTVDTRLLFPPTTWPGYEANTHSVSRPIFCTTSPMSSCIRYYKSHKNQYPSQYLHTT